MKRQQGGAKKPKGNKSRSKKKTKMSKLSYREKKKFLDPRNLREAKMTFRKFEETMQDSRIEWDTESQSQAILEEQKYKAEIAKSSEPTYDNLQLCDKKDGSVRLMLVNVNCLSL